MSILENTDNPKSHLVTFTYFIVHLISWLSQRCGFTVANLECTEKSKGAESEITKQGQTFQQFLPLKFL